MHLFIAASLCIGGELASYLILMHYKSMMSESCSDVFACSFFLNVCYASH